ncbi:uncharacterized protein HaLaN_00464, partial [Haematococcus lacustris]
MQAHAVNPATRHSAQPLLQGRARRGAECQATSSGGSPHRQQKRRARQPGLFEVTPPPKSLGIYALPPLTHTGEEIEVDGQGYVGKCVRLMWLQLSIYHEKCPAKELSGLLCSNAMCIMATWP